jgi:hypothetical protein
MATGTASTAAKPTGQLSAVQDPSGSGVTTVNGGTLYQDSSGNQFLFTNGVFQPYTAGGGTAGGGATSPQATNSNAGTAPAGAGSPNSPYPATSPSPGLISSFVGQIGQAKGPVVVGLTLAVFGAAVAGLIAVPLAIGLLIALLGIDIVTGGITQAAQGVENWFRGTDQNGNPVAGSPFAPGGILSNFASGYLGDFVIAATIGGLIYYFSHSGGQTTVRVIQASKRANPSGTRPRLRHRRIRRVN